MPDSIRNVVPKRLPDDTPKSKDQPVPTAPTPVPAPSKPKSQPLKQPKLEACEHINLANLSVNSKATQ